MADTEVATDVSAIGRGTRICFATTSDTQATAEVPRRCFKLLVVERAKDAWRADPESAADAVKATSIPLSCCFSL